MKLLKAAETDAERALMSGKDYCGIIGSLLYAAMMTRPDIAFFLSTSRCSRAAVAAASEREEPS